MLQDRSFPLNRTSVIMITIGVILVGMLGIGLALGVQPIRFVEQSSPSSGFDAQRVAEAGAARMTGLAGHYFNLYGSSGHNIPDQIAAQIAESARLQGVAGQLVNLHGSSSRVNAASLSPAQRVEVSRLIGMAGRYVNMFGSTNWLPPAELTRSQQADADRWTGWALDYDQLQLNE